MKLILPGRDQKQYIVIEAFISQKSPISIHFLIKSWEKAEPGIVWAHEDGKGFHESSCWPRDYKDGKMNWYADDTGNPPGPALSVIQATEKFCKQIVDLKAFL